MTPKQFKDKTRQIAQERNLHPQIVQRYFMMEKLLEKIADSNYNQNFILKGGFLIGSKYGIDKRSTVDIDTTFTNTKLTEQTLSTIFEELTQSLTKEGIRFELTQLKETREADYYPGFQAKFIAYLDTARIPFKLDITSGDSIYPEVVSHEHQMMFDAKKITISAYPTEQILAEKLHATFSFSTDNSRMKDFYDLYTIPKLEEVNISNLYNSVKGTFTKRNNQMNLYELSVNQLSQLKESTDLEKNWLKYQKDNSYAKGITYKETTDSIEILLNELLDFEKSEQVKKYKISQKYNQEMEK